MAFQTGLLRRVQASKIQDYSGSSASDEDEQDYYGPDAPTSTENTTNIPNEDSASENEGNAETPDTYSEPDPDPKSLLSTISFADLASAQASLGLPRKRKQGSSANPASSQSRSPSPFHEAQERLAGKSIPRLVANARTSKHSPAEMSSKKAVSRKRTVVATAKVEARDPRFSSLSGGLNANKVAQNYAFLNEYRADEMRELKAQARNAKDGVVRERLKGELRVMEDRERARKKVEDERGVVREHRKKEAEAVKQGKKPFYLKKADIKKQVLVKKFEDLGEKKAEKVMERKRKKKAARQRKAMPSSRREIG